MRIVAPGRADRLGEGLCWSAREQALYWVDILGQRINRLTLADDRVESWPMPQTIGWIAERELGGFVAGLGRRIVALTLEPLSIETIAEPEPERDWNRMNDALVTPAGEIWAGTMPIAADRPSGALYRLAADGSVARADDGYRIANGPALSADGRWLYHTDSALGTIYRFPVSAGGALGVRQDFITFEADWGAPDGMTVDAEGGLWVACWGGGCVTRFTPEGARDRAIRVPASQVTNCTFAGDALDRMFVTSAADGVDEPWGGALFEVDPGCTGMPTARYAG
jgi:sugar lactone lactonase YvrE